MLSQILKTTWPLFLGVSFLMLGNGLQGTLIGWRGAYEGFSSTHLGLIMAGYYVGFMLGSKFVQSIIEKVGHIRVFAALASTASTAILIQVAVISEPVWFGMRVITGFCFAGSYVVVESWLNARATNVTRGSLFSIYMIVTFASLTAGQWLFKLSDPSGYNLFILASVLLSFSLVPLLLGNVELPKLEQNESMGILKLYGICPAGVAGLLLVGLTQGIIFTMGAVYARRVGMDTTQIASFMSIMIAFGAVSQWPLGKLSDLIDRRLVIICVSAVASLVCIALLQIGPSHRYFILLYGVFGALNLPLYSLAVAHTNDRLKHEQIVAASGTMVLVFGIGSVMGPLSMGFVLDYAGNASYFIQLAILHAILAIVTLVYLSLRARASEKDLVNYHSVPPRATAVAMEAISFTMEDEDEVGQDSQGNGH
jgi:MFS family permease